MCVEAKLQATVAAVSLYVMGVMPNKSSEVQWMRM